MSVATRCQTSFIAVLRSNADEDLIKFAWPQDVWFHVDKLSSAHVYLRMPDGMTWDHIPEPLLVDCAQLVKANSIEGRVNFAFHSTIDRTISHDQGIRRMTSPSSTRRLII